MVKSKIISVMEEDWDYLIILDACRYDYFSTLYKNYLSGELYKVFSPGSNTPDWCKKSFTKYYSDVVYISGNPFINSKLPIADFDAKKHFFKIIDIWKSGWSEELGGVPPERINETTLRLASIYPQKKFIIHYLQPHEPYLAERFKIKGFYTPDLSKGRILSGLQNSPLNKDFEKLVNLLNLFLERTNLVKDSYRLREIFKLPPCSPLDAIRRQYGVEGLREAYKANLEIVLKIVAELCKELLSQNSLRHIIISADHGEFLGENRTFGHWCAKTNPFLRRHPILTEVPWLEVKPQHNGT